MLPPDWKELAPLLDVVLDAAPEERAALIVQLCQGNRACEDMLARLLADCERDAPLLDGVAAERFDGLADEPEAPLLPELVGERYRTGRELGSGGMARVYLARDLKHDRDVAIKVIRPDLSATLGQDRFLREIDIAARLRHPNIVPVYDSGQVEGSLYFVMPYEEGPSLRQRLEAGPLPLADALNVLRDVARALAHAHEHGVMHRDVKPDNVMLSGDAAVVTDFGIAKALSAALTDAPAATLTQSGSAIGTPAYMAPEQATGDPSIDHRADIYSFGCLAYEVFTGRPPFDDRSVHVVIAAHLTKVPRPVSELRTDIPPALAELIGRCLEKSPDDRPQNARELLAPLDSTVATEPAPVMATRPPDRRSAWPLRGGALLLLLMGLAGAGVYIRAHRSRAPTPLTLAVLPFGNSAGDSSLSYVSDGLADDVAGALARVAGIQIKSRIGARAYRGQLGPDVTEAGARLQADYLITGAVRQAQGHWILSSELVRAADNASLWEENFNISDEQQAGAAESIAQDMVVAMRSLFPGTIGEAPALASNQRTSNSEAYRLYLRGQEKLDRREGDIAESITLFRQAIHEDTTFARPYAGLSMVLTLSPYYLAVPPRDVNDEVNTAARRALTLDSTLAVPHVALGMMAQYNFQWDRAQTELETAVRLEPRNVEARVQLAHYLLYRGRTAEALAQLNVAREEDPASALVLTWRAYTYYLMGQIDSALVEGARALENDSASVPTSDLRVRVLLATHRFNEARQFADRIMPWNKLLYLGVLGDTVALRGEMHRLDTENPRPWYAGVEEAVGYLAIQDTAQALTALEQATDRGENWVLIYFPSEPVMAPLRGSARFQALLRRVGLPP